MGICQGKNRSQVIENNIKKKPAVQEVEQTLIPNINGVSEIPFHKNTPLNSATSTPLRRVKHPFPPPSPARHIKAFLAGRQKSIKRSEASIAEGNELGVELDKTFGFSNQLFAKYELGEEVGRGHFGYTCSATVKKGQLKGEEVAVKVILKSKMTTAIAMEDVKREVKILHALAGHKNLVQFYDVFEDDDNVYIVMELCRGGELLDRILSRGGKYSEKDAKAIILQILSVTAYCHLQGVVHRDLKPENFLFSTNEEDSPLKAIDFGLSDFVNPEERLNDIVGSAYYVAPEVLHRSYGTEADMWSIGVIAYILLCGSRPFWARSESDVFRAVMKIEPNFDELPWPSLSRDARDLVKKLLNKDYRQRLTAAQALCHPWFSNYEDIVIPLDIPIFKLIRTYIHTSPLRRSALVALAKTLNSAQLAYFQKQFTLLGPNKKGLISVQSFKSIMLKSATDAMKDSRVLDYVNMVSSLQYKKMDFEEFRAAALSVHQLEGMESWEQHAHDAFELFEKDGNRTIIVEELATELGLSSSIPMHVVLHDWVRPSDGKLSYIGYIKLLHSTSSQSSQKILR